MESTTARQKRLLTFHGNLRDTRYGWLRLTPAYSLHLVKELLNSVDGKPRRVLDPFCGTGTTALVCAEQGISCDTMEINPFLVWLAQTKCHPYSDRDVKGAQAAGARVSKAIGAKSRSTKWVPALHQIDKWWDPMTLQALARARSAIQELNDEQPKQVVDVLNVVFCRTMIEHARVSFGHQSMSFKKATDESPDLPFKGDCLDSIIANWSRFLGTTLASASSQILQVPNVIEGDSRDLTTKLHVDHYDVVITSPPYPNRMSYIRELRPYMYWLGYLMDGREAGELDWKAIGGTWGCATSNVAKWKSDTNVPLPYDGFDQILKAVAKKSEVLSKYIHKYFRDIVLHARSLYRVVRTGGVAHYIVGNSKFYDVILPVEEVYSGILSAAGFHLVDCRSIRKRSSKKELFEFVVTVQKRR